MLLHVGKALRIVRSALSAVRFSCSIAGKSGLRSCACIRSVFHRPLLITSAILLHSLNELGLNIRIFGVVLLVRGSRLHGLPTYLLVLRGCDRLWLLGATCRTGKE